LLGLNFGEDFWIGKRRTILTALGGNHIFFILARAVIHTTAILLDLLNVIAADFQILILQVELVEAALGQRL